MARQGQRTAALTQQSQEASRLFNGEPRAFPMIYAIVFLAAIATANAASCEWRKICSTQDISVSTEDACEGLNGTWADGCGWGSYSCDSDYTENLETCSGIDSETACNDNSDCEWEGGQCIPIITCDCSNDLIGWDACLSVNATQDSCVAIDVPELGDCSSGYSVAPLAAAVLVAMQLFN